MRRPRTYESARTDGGERSAELRELRRRIGELLTRGLTAPCDGVHGAWRFGWDAEPVHDLTDDGCAVTDVTDQRDHRGSRRHARAR